MQRVTLGSTLLTIIGVCAFILFVGDEDCGECYSADAMIGRGVACGLAIIIIAVISTWRYKRMEGIVFDIANQPILETNEATEGVSFASEGTIVADTLVESHFSKTPCVYYHSILEERVRTGKRATWVVRADMVGVAPFYLQDERGRIQIDVRNVDQDNSGHKITHDNTERVDHKYSEIDAEAPRGRVHFSENKKTFRKSEYLLKAGTPAFVYGYVEKEKSGLVLREHKDHPLIISRKTHKEYIKEFYRGEKLIYYAHLLVFVGFSLIVMLPAFWQWLPFGVHLLVMYTGGVVVLSSAVLTMYNRIVLLKNRLHNARANVEAELKRRHDLIPRFVTVVQGYMKHEKEVQKLLTAIRNRKQVTAVVEAYPELKASAVFQKLLIGLVDTEERIAYARNFYNGAVGSYNTCIQQIPFNLLAILFHFHKEEFIAMEKK